MNHDEPWFTGSMLSWRPANVNGWLFIAVWTLSFVGGVLLLEGDGYVHVFALSWIALLYAVRAIKGSRSQRSR